MVDMSVWKGTILSLTLVSHITLQHSVGQLSSRLLDDLADFLKLFLCLCRFVLRVLVLSTKETQIERGQMRQSDHECSKKRKHALSMKYCNLCKHLYSLNSYVLLSFIRLSTYKGLADVNKRHQKSLHNIFFCETKVVGWKSARWRCFSAVPLTVSHKQHLILIVRLCYITGQQHTDFKDAQAWEETRRSML